MAQLLVIEESIGGTEMDDKKKNGDDIEGEAGGEYVEGPDGGEDSGVSVDSDPNKSYVGIVVRDQEKARIMIDEMVRYVTVANILNDVLPGDAECVFVCLRLPVPPEVTGLPAESCLPATKTLFVVPNTNFTYDEIKVVLELLGSEARGVLETVAAVLSRHSILKKADGESVH